MGKALTRIGIIGLVAYGGWYLWSADTPTEAPTEDVKIETETEIPAKNEENLTFEIKKGDKKEIPAEIKETILKPVNIVETAETSAVKVAEITNTPVVISDLLTANTAKFVENADSTAVNVYFYDYGIDLSAKEIPAGNVVFRALNNGRLSHDLTIKDGNGQVDFGRIAPGETKYFKINLKAGYFDILSQVRADQDHDMIDLLIVK